MYSHSLQLGVQFQNVDGSELQVTSEFKLRHTVHQTGNRNILRPIQIAIHLIIPRSLSCINKYLSMADIW